MTARRRLIITQGDGWTVTRPTQLICSCDRYSTVCLVERVFLCGLLVRGTMRVAVVGIAGRDRDMKKFLTRRLFESMVQTIARKLTRPNETVLISGGAAWADHVAVTLFLRGKVAGLELHLPCEWDSANTQFIDTGAAHWASNPGRSANQYVILPSCSARDLRSSLCSTNT